ncbi:alpha/beta fold hydrolase [Nocardia jinanensis]|uniref:alpha/beta fold hydrolase n=1 Tax=Nocardia jinanensis TaxID=382504 RepID=UPI0007386894|nr:alpha/beta hydrolase [Nocardia jinanensis]
MGELQVGQVNNNGVELVVAQVGEGDPALLFLHPNAADHTFFGPQVAEFGGRHRVVAIDQRGHGGSGKPAGPYTPAVLAEDALSVIDQLGLDRPVVLGSSMGGAVALELAAGHPDAVRGLVLFNRSIAANPAMRDRITSLGAALRGDQADAALESLVGAQVGELDAPGLRVDYLRMAQSVPPWVLASLMEGFADWDGEASLRRVTVPTLFTFSHMTGNYAELDRLVELSSQVVIGHTVGAGHFDHLTVPEQINPMLRRFLDVYVD